jgi:5-methylcytosine-specific restriction endonuclease McrA
MARKLHDWSAVQAYHDEGHGFAECSRRFGFTHTAWNKAIRRGALRAVPSRFPDRRRRYDWAAVQAYYDRGHSYRACIAYFGFSADAWTDALRRGELRARARALSLDAVTRSKTNRGSIKRRLLELGVLLARCSRCGIADWRGKPLSIHLDHINGIKDDNRLENLRMLCPNCHSQTPTFAGRNAKGRSAECRQMP